MIAIAVLSILSDCTYRPKEKRLAKFMNTNYQILESYYKKTGDTIAFERFLSNGPTLTIQSGEIFSGNYALIQQRFNSVLNIPKSDNTLDSLRTQFKTDGFTAKLTDNRDVMFVQIIPDTAMSNMDALGFLNLRQDIEGKIDNKLQNSNLGEWFAGDMGAGGNMLFYIDNWQASMKIVNEILKDEELLDHVLIAKQVMATDEDWIYEVVYPAEYQGVFNPM